MGNVNAFINERMKKSKHATKMTALAKQSAKGDRSGFAGIFRLTELSQHEKETIEEILREYSIQQKDYDDDLQKIVSISSEVKAINNQAALLHGERIKKVQEILKEYQEGAFTAWLLATYGNRQTPYNFLQYYEFYSALPKELHAQLEMMPRQAVYTLASREGDIKKKQMLIKKYDGETKEEILELIREIFPLRTGDRRRKSKGEQIIQDLNYICAAVARYRSSITKRQKNALQNILETIQDMIA